jgi:tetratricopeptide (TPR) repeat protein
VVSTTLLVLFAASQASGLVVTETCRDGQLSIVTTVRELLDRGDDQIAREALGSLSTENSGCASLELTRIALVGWFEARALAPYGGAAERLGPARKALQQLGELRLEATAPSPQQEAFAIQVEYARTALQAAIAAAQDERPEMELLLGHARDLVQRLEQRSVRARWPQPFNLLAGELWFEVDRYEEARASYERAVQSDASPAALVGLARAQARLGRYDLACATYKRVREVGATLRETAKDDLARCR